MPSSNSIPTEGAKCLSDCQGHWALGVVHRINEDGTFTIEFDQKSMMLPYWFGVTQNEISFNDESLWPEVFARLTSGLLMMGLPAFASALRDAGYTIDDEKVKTFWTTRCEELFDFRVDAANRTITSDQAYQLVLNAGFCAKSFVAPDQTAVKYCKPYWNQTRMGGRQPSDIHRVVTLDDAFMAMGIQQPRLDQESVSRVEAFQNEKGIKLPANLYRLFCCSGISRAVVDSHPNSPHLVFPGDHGEFWRDPPLRETKADYALQIISPHQADFVWAAVFNRDDSDARVYLNWDDNWSIAAPTLGMFFWDLAQTGLVWFQDTQFQGGKAIEPTDIGVAPKNA